jgi:hypothetical protein
MLFVPARHGARIPLIVPLAVAGLYFASGGGNPTLKLYLPRRCVASRSTPLLRDHFRCVAAPRPNSLNSDAVAQRVAAGTQSTRAAELH